ncbi:hypothetical protein [Thermococcus sp. 2319x1]|uniref:hypothetical protein n=1 Tax=Thermococcus sp. 2319x1 TaxID=1674923 RepID=UPI001E45876A|nr:hypothetical protein [Thermococcus sp. 2319x1]
MLKSSKEHGIKVVELEPLEKYPDSVFVQDTAIVGVKSNLAVLSRFGEPSRRGEEKSIGEILKGEGFEVKQIEEPGTLW